MSKASFIEPRVIKLSWRPPFKAGRPIAPLVERLTLRLKVSPWDDHGRRLELIDVNEAGKDRAHPRRASWTDFVAVYTIDYCSRCAEEREASELAEVLREPRARERLLWLIRVDRGNPARDLVGELEPWRDAGIWRFLPAPHPAPPLPTRQFDEMDDALEEVCLTPLRAADPWAADATDDNAGVAV